MKTTHLKARYSTAELRKWAESPACAEALKEACERAKKKLHGVTLSQLRELRRSLRWRSRWDGRVLVDPKLSNISHLIY